MPSSELLKIINKEIPLDFNWNSDLNPQSPIPFFISPEPTANQIKKMLIVDEGLRDGLHGVSQYPSVSKMLEYINLVSEIGIKAITVGIFSSEGIINITIKKLLKKLRENYPHISPIVLSLASEESIKWAAECKSINPKLQVLVFMGSSPSRMLVENWSKKYVLEKLASAISLAVKKYKLLVIGATEHTTQTPPDFLREIIKIQVKNGINFFCIADTIGTARPLGTFRIVKFVKKILRELGRQDILIDWHGHNDLGLATANALTALAAGANRIHLVPFGIGERAGNSSLQELLINVSQILQEKGFKRRWNLIKISDLLNKYIEITGNQMPVYGCLGQRAFSTSLGIHTSAILKAEQLAKEAADKKLNDLAVKLKKMARTVYTAIDPHIVRREYEIEIGPWSGRSTVKLWANSFKKKLTSLQIERVLKTAKRLKKILSKEEILRLIQEN